MTITVLMMMDVIQVVWLKLDGIVLTQPEKPALVVRYEEMVL